MARSRFLAGLAMAGLLAGLLPTAAAGQQVQAQNFADYAFGTISSFGSNISATKNICVYAGLTSNKYAVTATGSGSGGAFTLLNSTTATTMGYEVQWAGSSGQSTGTALTAGTLISGFTSTLALLCTVNLLPTASLIINLPSTETSSARAGNYTGTLTILITAQ